MKLSRSSLPTSGSRDTRLQVYEAVSGLAASDEREERRGLRASSRFLDLWNWRRQRAGFDL